MELILIGCFVLIPVAVRGFIVREGRAPYTGCLTLDAAAFGCGCFCHALPALCEERGNLFDGGNRHIGIRELCVAGFIQHGFCLSLDIIGCTGEFSRDGGDISFAISLISFVLTVSLEFINACLMHFFLSLGFCGLLFEIVLIAGRTLIVFLLDGICNSLNEFVNIKRNTIYNVSKTALGIDGKIIITEADNTLFACDLTLDFLLIGDNVLTASLIFNNVAVDITNPEDIFGECIRLS